MTYNGLGAIKPNQTKPCNCVQTNYYWIEITWYHVIITIQREYLKPYHYANSL